MNDQIRMQVSAFVDGELPENEAELLLRRLSQDAELRQLAAEFMAMGRAMRGERVTVGQGGLRARIAAALDDQAFAQDQLPATKLRPRLLRPIAGVAIAATVALAAIVSLQRFAAVPGIPEIAPGDAIVATDPGVYTVPDRDDAQLRQYRLRHAVSTSSLDPNAVNAQLATLELADGALVEIEPEEEPDEAGDDAGEALDTP